MTTENEIYIGDENTFAIRYVPGFSYKDSGHYYAHCHIVLAGQLIGDKDELCFLSSWKYSLELLKDQIKNDFDSIKHIEFKNRTDREIFELIWKANQSKADFKPQYAHLLVLESKVWSSCRISIDETTDAYLITMTELDGHIKFLWEGWRDPCPVSRIGELFTVAVDKDFVVSTIEKCLDRIEKEYLNYPKL